MSRATAKAREEFVQALLRKVPTATRAHAEKLMRWGATYARLAEAECNGDYPYFGSWRSEMPFGRGIDMQQCVECEAEFAMSQQHRNTDGDAVCPSCRAERIIRETCASMGEPFKENVLAEEWPDWVTPHFQDDPRGHTVRLQIVGEPLDAYDRAALAVPTS